jgi:hypothetical protein
MNKSFGPKEFSLKKKPYIYSLLPPLTTFHEFLKISEQQ